MRGTTLGVMGKAHAKGDAVKTTRNLFAAAFVASVFLAACDRNEAPESAIPAGESGPATTVMQPDKMPAPEVPADLAAGAPPARDAAATKPMDDLTAKKEQKTMPEAGHGNNHSSPALKKSTVRTFRKPEVKVLWI